MAAGKRAAPSFPVSYEKLFHCHGAERRQRRRTHRYGEVHSYLLRFG